MRITLFGRIMLFVRITLFGRIALFVFFTLRWSIPKDLPFNSIFRQVADLGRSRAGGPASAQGLTEEADGEVGEGMGDMGGTRDRGIGIGGVGPSSDGAEWCAGCESLLSRASEYSLVLGGPLDAGNSFDQMLAAGKRLWFRWLRWRGLM